MNKISLIAKREFLTRVQKKTFLLTTILLPLLFCFWSRRREFVSMRKQPSRRRYVNTFDGGKPAVQLRQELIERLRKSKYQIVESPAEADAVINGLVRGAQQARRRDRR